MEEEKIYDTYDTIKKDIIQALEKTLGIVTTACKMVKISRETYYRYRREDKIFANDCDNVNEVTLDFAESALHKNIQAGRETSIIFFLKTKGRKRGYIEEVLQPPKQTIIIEGRIKGLDHIDDSNKPDNNDE